jgi:hypothetical protein
MGLPGVVAVTTAALLLAFGGASSGQTAAPGRPAPPENKDCLECHDTILDAKTLKPDVKEAHRRHLESMMTEFGGRQRVCTTCHEAFVRGRPAGIDGAPVMDYFHPTTSNQPTEYWRLRVRKLEVPDAPPSLPLITPADPQIFKPTLRRLVCVECHSPRLKTLYPGRDR